MASGNDCSIDDLFPFVIGEERLLKELASRIRASLPSLVPAEIQLAATFLHALERFPYRSDGVSISFARSTRTDTSYSYASAQITEDTFALSLGGSVFDDRVGSDSHSATLLWLEVGGARSGSISDFERWLKAFCGEGEVIEIENDGDWGTSLDAPLPQDGWERLAGFWDTEGNENYDY